MTSRFVLPAALALATVAVLPEPADAQSLRERLRQRAQEQVERRIEQRVEEAVEKSMDRTEDAIRCVVTDVECIGRARDEGRTIVYTDGDGNVVDAPPAVAASTASAPSLRVGEGAWANYDFVPGEQALFSEDFSRDRVGNFPRRLEFVAGNLEIVDWQGAQYLRSTGESAFNVTLPEALPERFTIEFDLHTGSFLWDVAVVTEPKQAMHHVHGHDGSIFTFGRRSGMAGRDVPNAITATPQVHEQLVPVRIMVDGSYAKVFLGEQRIANIPNARIGRTDKVQFWIQGNADDPSFIGNIRIAAGGASLYDALEADGRVSTQGILFDTGSDRIRPESTPTLKEIARMLEEHAELRLRVEGHTDATGSAEANLQLSERRAAAVRDALVESFGVDAARLEAVGRGQEEPVDGNDTPEGRQNNRRVVLVRL